MAEAEKTEPLRRTVAMGMFAVVAIGAVFASAAGARAATLSLEPAAITKVVGDQFTVTLYADATDEPVNAVSAELQFPADKLQAVWIGRESSTVSFWAQEPSFSNSDGSVHLEGIIVNPGLSGRGKIASITFAAKAPGTASITFLSGSLLANNGQGTNVLSALNDATVTISPRAASTSAVSAPVPAATTAPQENSTAVTSTIFSTSHPDENTWYPATDIALNWSLPPHTNAISELLDRDPGTTPPAQPQPPTTSFTQHLDPSQSGIWYFHLMFHTPAGWSRPVHRKIQVDAEPPQPFTISEKSGPSTDAQPQFQWQANDPLSGLAKYQTQIDSGDWIDPTTLQQGAWYKMPKQQPGEHWLTVRAYDAAGNFTDARLAFTVAATDIFAANYPGRLLASSGTVGLVAFLVCLIFIAATQYRAIRLLLSRQEQFQTALQKDVQRFEHDIARADLEKLQRLIEHGVEK